MCTVNHALYIAGGFLNESDVFSRLARRFLMFWLLNRDAQLLKTKWNHRSRHPKNVTRAFFFFSKALFCHFLYYDFVKCVRKVNNLFSHQQVYCVHDASLHFFLDQWTFSWSRGGYHASRHYFSASSLISILGLESRSVRKSPAPEKWLEHATYQQT